MRNRFIIETLGTFFLCCAGMMSEAPLITAGLLCALLYAGAPLSGSHYNPAVTLGVWLRGRLPDSQTWVYFLAQVVGALLAALVVGALLGYDDERAKEVVAALGDHPFDGAVGSSVTELLGTFLVVLVFLLTTTSRLTAGNSYFGIAVALTYLGVVGAFAQFNPGLNPAQGLAHSLQNLTAVLFSEEVDNRLFQPELALLAKIAPRVALDMVCQLAGGLAAAQTFRVLYPEDR